MRRPGDRVAADVSAATVAAQPGMWPDPTIPLDERGGGTALTVVISLGIFVLAVTFAIVVNSYPSALSWVR
jgi:hypothetical protein